MEEAKVCMKKDSFPGAINFTYTSSNFSQFISMNLQIFQARKCGPIEKEQWDGSATFVRLNMEKLIIIIILIEHHVL